MTTESSVSSGAETSTTGVEADTEGTSEEEDGKEKEKKLEGDKWVAVKTGKTTEDASAGV